MKITPKVVIQYVVALAVALGLLYLAFRNVDLEEFWAKAKEVDYFWIYVSIVLSLIPYVLRAYRWNLLLEPVGYSDLSTWRTSLAVIIGYLANLALPRMGEVTRCVMLNRSDNVKVSAGFGTVITERIIDFITLNIIIGITFLLEFDKLMAFFDKFVFSNYEFSLTTGLLLATVVLIVLVIGFVIARRILQNPSPSNKIVSFIREIIEGFGSVRNVRNLPGFILSSIGIWVAYYFMSYIIVFTIEETSHLDWIAGLALLVTGGIGMAAPVQGGIGTFHLFVSAMLISYGIEQQTGLFLATLLHTSQVGAILIFGALAVLISFFISKRKVKNAVAQ